LSEGEEFYPESLVDKLPWDSSRVKLTNE
jgi:hypothetical protein